MLTKGKKHKKYLKRSITENKKNVNKGRDVMGKIIFRCEGKKAAWTGNIQIKEECENYVLAEVEARGTTFLIVLSCYYSGYGIKEWCVCVPNLDFGCKVSETDMEWNLNQFRPYIKKEVDRISLMEAIKFILTERILDNGK